MDLGIVGNCQYNALIDPSGEVVWLCWPRFDSSFVFGSLLDLDKGGSFRVGPVDNTPGVQSYLPNTNVLRTEHRDEGGRYEVIDFAPRFYQYQRYYKPTMLIRIVRPLEGEPMVRACCRPTWDYGRKTLEPVIGSNHIRFNGAPQPIRLTTNASLTMVMEERPFVVDRTYYFVLTFGSPLESPLEITCEDFLDQTVRYWRTWVKHSYIPRDYQEEVIRSALVLKLHQYEDTGAIIAATTTSIPEAENTVRNWDYRYCWLRDALFSLLALQRLTHFEEMEGFVTYLRNLTARLRSPGGRLQPVYGISGREDLTEEILDHLEGYRGHKPVRVGNQAHEHIQHDVYGEMMLAISRSYLDVRFLSAGRKPSLSLVIKLLDRIEAYMEDKDAGLWEFRGIAQLHTFTVLMHWCGAVMAEEIGRRHGESALAGRAAKLAARAKKILEEKCWDPEIEAFTQAAGIKEMDASLLMLINFGFLHQDDPRANSQIEAIKGALSTENGFIHRYIHEDDFGETANSFTICSFWLAEALARVGRRDEAEKLFHDLLGCANSLGLYSEDIDPRTKTQWGNFPQAYSHVGLINAAFALSRRGDAPLDLMVGTAGR